MTEEKLVKKFENLSEDWRNSVNDMGSDAVKFMLAEIAKLEDENKREKEEDQELLEAKAKYDTSKEGYTETTKRHRLEVMYGLWVLRNRGK